jgi:hypothetical protein
MTHETGGGESMRIQGPEGLVEMPGEFVAFRTVGDI